MKVGKLLNIEVRLLVPADLPLLEALVSEHVSYRYPGTEPDYALSLAQDFLTARIRRPSFTIARIVYTVTIDGRAAGFVVASNKLGGSVKLGPVVVTPKFRRSGLGRQLLLDVEKRIKRANVRRLYLTTPADDNDAMRGLALELGFSEEAVLRRQFSLERDEIVLGKVLTSGDSSLNSSEGTADDFGWLGNQLCKLFYDADGNRNHHIARILHRSGLNDFSEPGWRLVTHATSATFVDPKRGGSVRLGPITYSDKSLQEGLIRSVLDLPWVRASRRQFATFRTADKELLEIFFNYGFQLEGRLIAPHRPNEDAFVVGKVS
jgi:GNAT superfamily N-acetyltransferase